MQSALCPAERTLECIFDLHRVTPPRSFAFKLTGTQGRFAHIYKHSQLCYYVYPVTDKLSTTTLYLELHYVTMYMCVCSAIVSTPLSLTDSCCLPLFTADVSSCEHRVLKRQVMNMPKQNFGWLDKLIFPSLYLANPGLVHTLQA